MSSKKHFLQDRTALLLVSGNAFLTLAAVALVLLRLNSSRTSSTFIIQCRDCTNTLDLNRFTSGSLTDILSFIAFAIMVFGLSIVLGYRAYKVKRELSLVILGLTLLLLVFQIVIANSLLVLR
jgi:hypothetical protein